MYFGAAYYPEHWPEERWNLDAQMMKEAGFNVVRMAEFAWTRFEPEEGIYDFSWLDRAIDILAAHGIQAILGTPTAAPPKWLVDRHPDIFPIDFKGHVKGYGHRRYYCYNNHNLRHHVRAITEKMAGHYTGNPAVIGWQIDNELGCVDTVRCFCSNCRKEFQIWLRRKYGTIDQLNDQWGTVFSNQIYGSFDEVILPTYGPITLHNPGLELDFRRFSSDSVRKFQALQADILHEKAPAQKVTTNMTRSGVSPGIRTTGSWKCRAAPQVATSCASHPNPANCSDGLGKPFPTEPMRLSISDGAPVCSASKNSGMASWTITVCQTAAMRKSRILAVNLPS